MIIELLHANVKMTHDMHCYFLPFSTARKPRIGPITGVEYSCDMTSHNKKRTIKIGFNDLDAILSLHLRESHREMIPIEYKIGDPDFRLETVAQLIDTWLHWKIKYKELGKDTR